MTIRLLQISDCHLFADTQKCGYADINPLLTLNAVLDSAKKERPDRILLTGDVSGDGSVKSYQHLYNALDSRGWLANTRMIPGNHDDPNLMMRQFNDKICRVNGFEDVGQWRFHYLNSHHEGTKGLVEKSRLDELEQDISQASEKHQIVAVHHHPLDCIHWMDKHDWVNRDEFLQLMHFMPKPVRVLYGHVHHAVNRTFNAQEYYACPSTCWQWAQTEQFGVSDVAPGYRMIELGNNGEWLTWINRIEWSVDLQTEA
ncbi:metallophosphoesterase [Alteromonas sp. a30]|uniref:metallophosphoesterase n=1 Tax=Alteromonas sp. a30 TaxID=2730917 RepID=UPI00227E2D29|nr:metallophosphoesterase [Alteromonas sp. a30]MCY7296279.1 metallophosphoesterase [Alteromonas sp. a30]